MFVSFSISLFNIFISNSFNSYFILSIRLINFNSVSSSSFALFIINPFFIVSFLFLFFFLFFCFALIILSLCVSDSTILSILFSDGSKSIILSIISWRFLIFLSPIFYMCCKVIIIKRRTRRRITIICISWDVELFETFPFITTLRLSFIDKVTGGTKILVLVTPVMFL